MHFGVSHWPEFNSGIKREWLETNGLGGYAASTLINANTRRYHGLLIAALHPPLRRTLMVANILEEIELPGQKYYLSAYQTASGYIAEGYRHLQHLEVDEGLVFTYGVADLILEKRILMIRGENMTLVSYRVRGGAEPANLRLSPLINYRDHHWTISTHSLNFTQEGLDQGLKYTAYHDAVPFYIFYSDGFYTPSGYWFEGMSYPRERERGLEDSENHFMPGVLTLPVPASTEVEVHLALTTRKINLVEAMELRDHEIRRRSQLTVALPYSDFLPRRLAAAADCFLVQRQSTQSTTVIAGYPWFTDWGRDTMIALPGLTLVTGRFELARELLQTFARHMRHGLLPNMFPDDGQEAIYNTVDAPLWFFQAVYKYLEYTGDDRLVQQELLPVLQEIYRAYRDGTDFGIGMDPDGLIRAGNPEVQLTWMDAKVDDWVVTPRDGKAVEINALWYNALLIMGCLEQRYGIRPTIPANLPEKVAHSFQALFWNNRKQCLADYVREGQQDVAIRPNQILAVSLPFMIIKPEWARKIVWRVWQDLYTPYGLRTLAPQDPGYQGTYGGDRYQRDGAYHQGSAWSWLLGPFITAYRRINGYSPASREVAGQWLAAFEDHLRDAGVGFVSEIFDGDFPHHAQGCIAQAWGVAEILRAYVEDYLEIKPAKLGF